MSNLPLLLPAFAVGMVAALVAGRPLGRVLRTSTVAAMALIAAAALVTAVTLTPQRFDAGAVDVFAAVPEVPPDAGLWHWPWQWWWVNDRTLNIALFVPLGFAVTLVGRRGARWALVAAALLAPLAVEGTQYVVAWLARDPQWQDVLDNTLGVLIGLGLGLLWRRLRPAARGRVGG